MNGMDLFLTCSSFGDLVICRCDAQGHIDKQGQVYVFLWMRFVRMWCCEVGSLCCSSTRFSGFVGIFSFLACTQSVRSTSNLSNEDLLSFCTYSSNVRLFQQIYFHYFYGNYISVGLNHMYFYVTWQWSIILIWNEKLQGLSCIAYQQKDKFEYERSNQYRNANIKRNACHLHFHC